MTGLRIPRVAAALRGIRFVSLTASKIPRHYTNSPIHVTRPETAIPTRTASRTEPPFTKAAVLRWRTRRRTGAILHSPPHLPSQPLSQGLQVHPSSHSRTPRDGGKAVPLHVTNILVCSVTPAGRAKHVPPPQHLADPSQG